MVEPLLLVKGRRNSRNFRATSCVASTGLVYKVGRKAAPQYPYARPLRPDDCPRPRRTRRKSSGKFLRRCAEIPPPRFRQNRLQSALQFRFTSSTSSRFPSAAQNSKKPPKTSKWSAPAQCFARWRLLPKLQKLSDLPIKPHFQRRLNAFTKSLRAAIKAPNEPTTAAGSALPLSPLFFGRLMFVQKTRADFFRAAHFVLKTQSAYFMPSFSNQRL